MTNLNLSGPQAGVLAVGLLAAGLALRAGTRPGVRRAAPYLVEAGVVAALYAAWQWLAGFAHGRLGVAVARGEWILHLQRDLHLPDERTLQRFVLPHPWLVQSANLYYAIAHFTAMGLVLAWVFVKHRDRYPRVRNVLVVVTGLSLAVQWIAVAPPRLLPGAGFVDTAASYGQSVYAPLTSAEVTTLLGVDFGADQLSAMPSVHVAWALLVALAVQTVATSRSRVLVWLHPVLTVFVIVVTANHWWLDGVVAAGLLALSIAMVDAGGRLRRLHRRRVVDRPGTTATERGDARTGDDDGDDPQPLRPAEHLVEQQPGGDGGDGGFQAHEHTESPGRDAAQRQQVQ